MRKNAALLYLNEHKWQLAALAAGCFGIGSILSWLERNMDYLYLGIVIFIMSFAAALIHLWRNYGFYTGLIRDVTSEDDFYLPGGSPLSESCNAMLRSQRNLYVKRLEAAESENSSYKILVSQWIHQMKTPLTVLSMLAEKNGNDPSFEKAGVEVKRMERLLNQIISMMRMERVGKDFIIERHSLSKLVKAAVNAQKTYFIEKGVYPTVEVDQKLYVYTDQKWFIFALEQLVNNAVKYSEPGKYVNISAEAVNEKVVLTVKDEGCGILKEDAGRVYELFYTGKNGRKAGRESTGIGLYIVKSVLDYLGHSISFTSVPGRGTAFRIEIS